MKEKKQLKVPAALSMAFSTRRHEFIELYFHEVRTKLAQNTLTNEEIEHILNALEMTAHELWEGQTAATAVRHITEDVRHTLEGLERTFEQLWMLSSDAAAGKDMPSLVPEEVREHYRNQQREG